MDPIKVDFSSKTRAREKEIVIPPEKATVKKIISLVLSAVTAVVAYYFMLPAFNLKDVNLYLYIGVVAISYVLFNGLLSSVFTKPEYTPYIKRRAIVPGVIVGILVVTALIGYLVGSEFFRAKSYSKLITVDDTSNFADSVDPISVENFSEIPRLDQDSASQVASRALGALGTEELVSQFTVSSINTQINYGSKPVRVIPLQYANVIKWLFNTSEGLPGYIMVDMADESAEFVTVEGGIKYSTAEHFNKLLKRQLRFNYPTKLLGESTFEVDDEGTPYWICPVLDNKIGLFGGTDVVGAILVKADSDTFDSKYYSVEEFDNDASLKWVDRVYDSTLVVQQYNFYGKYQKGFWNSILGQKGVKATTSGYSYIAKDGDVWMYTGVTSVTSDESIIGFLLVNQRTKASVFYSVTGGTEASAQLAAQGRVKDLGYTATFPLLINVGGEPTYFLSLKDDSNIVQQYALINVEQYNNNKMGVNGTDLDSCLNKYLAAIGKKESDLPETEDTNEPEETDNGGNKPESEVQDGTATGNVADIRTAVKGGESYYYIKLDAGDAYYVISASDDENVVILNKGDNVTVTFSGSGSIISADSITIN